MVLEATIVCVDNSEWMRNGDFAPSRMDAQTDAVNLLCSAKLQQNPENRVGLLSTAGKSARILVTSTEDVGAIFTCLHNMEPDGKSDFVAAVQRAQLALKHRQNQNQRQRIVVFVGSPVEANEEILRQLAKKLKKNGIAVDIVNFGEQVENAPKLEAFIEEVNSADNSHIISVAAGQQMLSDVLLGSPIIHEGAGMQGNEHDGGDGSFVDPTIDPELAMALRLSMEEEMRRQERESVATAGNSTTVEGQSSGINETQVSGPGVQPLGGAATNWDADLYEEEQGESMQVDREDDELARAIALSKQSNAAHESVADDDDDEEMRLALQLSMMDQQGTGGEEVAATLQEPENETKKEEKESQDKQDP